MRPSAASALEDDARLILPPAVAEEAWSPGCAQLEASLELRQLAEASKRAAAAVDSFGAVPVRVTASIRGSGGGIPSIMEILLGSNLRISEGCDGSGLR